MLTTPVSGAPLASLTCTGLARSVVLPSPSWPSLLRPQQKTVPSAFSAQEWRAPVETRLAQQNWPVGHAVQVGQRASVASPRFTPTSAGPVADTSNAPQLAPSAAVVSAGFRWGRPQS